MPLFCSSVILIHVVLNFPGEIGIGTINIHGINHGKYMGLRFPYGRINYLRGFEK